MYLVIIMYVPEIAHVITGSHHSVCISVLHLNFVYNYIEWYRDTSLKVQQQLFQLPDRFTVTSDLLLCICMHALWSLVFLSRSVNQVTLATICKCMHYNIHVYIEFCCTVK